MKDLSESRVLIVDDAKENIDILVEALRDEYKLSVALDGDTALRSVEKSPPDLVLLDIMMPGVDGYEVCRRLRSREATREVPVMFLSSLENVKDKAHGFEVGGNDYLTKPFEVLEIKARARSLLEGAVAGDRREQMRAALVQGGARARGAFSTSLDALTALLHERARTAVDRGNGRGARAAARALDAVEEAKELATGNVNPQLITSELLRQLEAVLR